jgi:hypothetical protein
MKTLLIVALLAAGAFALAAPAFAAQPTQADFDACNRMAQAAVSSPSASPQAGGVGPGGATGPTGSGPGGATTGGAPSGGATTGPSITTPKGTPDSTSGVQQGGAAGKTGPMITGSGREPGSTGGVREGTGAVSKDSSGAAQPGASSAEPSGMSERGKTDAAYKTAYQDCMKQRGF